MFDFTDFLIIERTVVLLIFSTPSSRSVTVSGRMVPLVSGSGKIRIVSVNAAADRMSRGKAVCTSSKEIISGEIIEPILENITDAPTPTFLNTVGYSSPVNR